MILPFGEWTPDVEGLSVKGLTVAENCVPGPDGYGPLNSLSDVTNALTAKCVGAAWFADKTGTVKVYAGDATKLYSLSGATWSNVSKSGNYTGGTNWEFALWGDRCIAVDPSINPQYIDMSRLKVRLGSEDGHFSGVLMLVRLTNLQGLNRDLGRAQTDKLLQDVAAAMSESALRLGSQEVGRLNGTDFALILPQVDALREPAVDDVLGESGVAVGAIEGECIEGVDVGGVERGDGPGVASGGAPEQRGFVIVGQRVEPRRALSASRVAGVARARDLFCGGGGPGFSGGGVTAHRTPGIAVGGEAL